MGAPNFSYENILAVIEEDLDYCERCDEEITQEDLGDGAFGCPICECNDCITTSDYSQKIDYVIEMINNDLFKLENSYISVYNDYDGFVGTIAKVRIHYKECDVDIKIVLRSGYYSHANIDYKIVSDDDDEYIDRARVQNTIKKIEDIIFTYTTRYKCDAIFSNGEAIYSKYW